MRDAMPSSMKERMGWIKPSLSSPRVPGSGLFLVGERESVREGGGGLFLRQARPGRKMTDGPTLGWVGTE